MGDDLAAGYLGDVRLRYRRLKTLADGAAEQIDDQAFHAALDPEGNSVALLMKHLAGNMRSRWRDLFTSDGEKPDRDRDREFERELADTRAAVLQGWDAGWQYLFDALESVGPEDLARTVHIRGRPCSAMEAINRQLAHYAYHVGQIVFLAKHFRGDDWQTLSVPRGGSRQFNESFRSAAGAT